MKKIKAGIIGATGYAGAELARLLVNHPDVEVAAVASVSYEGQDIADIYPNLAEILPMTLGNPDDIIPDCDVVFASVPHGVSEEIAVKCMAHDTVLIDLGADFRLHDENDYRKWYGKEYKHPELHLKAVYSIPELHRNEVKEAMVIGNPGCYPTSVCAWPDAGDKGGDNRHGARDNRLKVRCDRSRKGSHTGDAFPGHERGVRRVQGGLSQAHAGDRADARQSLRVRRSR